MINKTTFDPFFERYTKHKMHRLEPRQFPELLRQIADPPKSLYIMGGGREEIKGQFPETAQVWPDSKKDLSTKKEAGQVKVKFLCVVGSRRNSVYGKEVCEKLISGLAGYPVVIVSGLAFGIDSIAHKAALEAGLATIAIPGSGLGASVLYPRAHFNLACSILSAGGMLASEYPEDMQATLWSFPRRNRIMAGLSHALLVIEAEKGSGTKTTADLALDYNRDILAVPGSIFSQNTVGAHRLIREGARPVTSSLDILETLGLIEAPANDQSGNEKIKKPDLGQHKISKYDGCSQQEISLLTILQEPLSRNDLLEKSGLPISELNCLLSLLELKGLIKELNCEFSRT